MTIETEREADGRWIAEVSKLPGVIAYGMTKAEAIARARRLRRLPSRRSVSCPAAVPEKRQERAQNAVGRGLAAISYGYRRKRFHRAQARANHARHAPRRAGTAREKSKKCLHTCRGVIEPRSPSLPARSPSTQTRSSNTVAAVRLRTSRSVRGCLKRQNRKTSEPAKPTARVYISPRRSRSRADRGSRC